MKQHVPRDLASAVEGNESIIVPVRRAYRKRTAAAALAGAESASVSAMQPLDRPARALEVPWSQMGTDQIECGREDNHVIGEAKPENHVGNHIEWQNEIGQGRKKRAFDPQRRGGIGGAKIGGYRFFSKGYAAQRAGELAPEFPANHPLAAFQTFGISAAVTSHAMHVEKRRRHVKISAR